MRNTAILAKIAEVNADIWVLTETNESIRPDGYACLATPETTLLNPGERTAMICSRWPLREVPVLTDLADGDAVTRLAELHRPQPRHIARHLRDRQCPGSAAVYGTVVAYFGDRGPAGLSKYNDEQRA